MPSPLPYPHYPDRNIQLLDGIWDFAFLGALENPAQVKTAEVQYETRVSVPCCFDALPAYVGKRGTAVFRTHVHTRPNRRGLIRFGGIGQWAKIYVDGKGLAECAMPYTGFGVEVPASEESLRELVVVVDNQWSDERSPLHQPYYDFYAYGGIYRAVTWHTLPEGPYLDRAQVTTLDPESGRIRVVVRLGNGEHTEALDKVEIRVDGGDARIMEDVPCEKGYFSFEASIRNPVPWSPENPVLHTVAITARGDTVVERFGLRTVSTEGRMILLNGKPVKLLGYNRHEAHPQFGPALPHAQLVQDLQILRDLGCNYIRGSHYPQDQRFLDLCDELGFLVFEESLGWGNRAPQFDSPTFTRLMLEQTRLMVKNSFNHPCVIMWGFLNEGQSDLEENRKFYGEMAALLRAADKSRLVVYATNRIMRDMFLDLCDVVCVNEYPGWYTSNQAEARPLEEIAKRFAELQKFLKATGQGEKPLIISEIGAGAIYGWRDPHNAHWSEEYQRDYLDRVCELVIADEDIAGVALWQYCDGRTYSSALALGRPRAFNNKGTLDEYRRPKMAYAAVKKRFTEYFQKG